MRISFCIVVLCAGAFASAQLLQSVSGSSKLQRPPQMTGKGVIEGTVVNSMTQEPVKKAQVTLQGNASLNAVTDASGHFLFKDLAAGNFTVQASAMGYEGFLPRSRGPVMQQVKLEAEGKASGITLSLTPNGSIAGRVVDEDGAPMQHCNPTLMHFQDQQGNRLLTQRESAQSDEKGEYRITNVTPGKYYVLARCSQSKTLPHAFMERRPDVDIPSQTYAPVLYPGAPDLAGATQVTVAAGADLGGINFRMTPMLAVMVRGHLSTPDPEATQRNIQLSLHSRDPQLRQMMQYGAQVQPSGKFVFRNVVAGSYELEASTYGDGPGYYARIPVDVGAAPMDPIELTMASVGTLTGRITVEGDTNVAIENIGIGLNPVDRQFGMRPPNVRVQKDGTFVARDIVPGRWRVMVNGMPGYVKSISWNDQELADLDLEVASSGGKLNITLGTKWAQLDGSFTGDSTPGEPVNGLVWPTGAARRQMGGSRTANFDEKGHFQIGNMAPGKYHGCAIVAAQPWMLLQNETLLKKLESRCESFELTEGGHTTVQLPLISSSDLDRLFEEQ